MKTRDRADTRSADGVALQDSSGRWNQFSGRYAWDESCICSGNPQYGGTGATKQGSDFDAAPNVDHTSDRVRNVSRCFLNVFSILHASLPRTWGA